MATPAQIAANRANAQKSTGPRSVEGKTASCFNAFKHGIDAASIVIPGEDPAAYERIANNYYSEFRPASALEEFHVDTLIRCDWQKRRLQRIENKLYRALLAEGATPEDLDVAVLRDSPTAKLLRKVISQIASLERSLFRALADLRRIRRELENASAGTEHAPILQHHEFPRNEPNSAPQTTPLAVPDDREEDHEPAKGSV